MIVTTWIVKGLQQPCKQPVVADFIRSNKVDVMGLLETKFKDIDNINSFIARYFPAWKFTYVMASEREKTCQMLLLCNPQTVELDVVSVEEQVIHSKIRCTRSRSLFSFSLV